MITIEQEIFKARRERWIVAGLTGLVFMGLAMFLESHKKLRDDHDALEVSYLETTKATTNTLYELTATVQVIADRMENILKK